MIGHFNADDLASYRAGIVSESRAARISAHLSGCPQCADVHSGLDDLSQMLASIPAPPMPETLTARVHAAISHEAAQRGAATSAFSEVGRAAADDGSSVRIPGRPDLPERAKRPGRRPRIMAWSPPLLVRGLAAAGVIVLLVGGGIMLANQRSVQMSGTAAGPNTHRPIRSRHNNSAAVGSTPTVVLRYQHGAESAYANAVTSDVSYTKANLPAGIRSEVASTRQIGNAGSTAVPATAQPRPGRALSHTTVGRLESCLSSLASGRGLVLLVDVARYLRQPATIIVFRQVNSAYDVIVVGVACGATSQDIITSLSVPVR